MIPRLVLVAACLWVGLALGADLPARSRAPVVNPDVTQANIHATICVAGWTKTVRPPASYTNKLKAAQLGVKLRSAKMRLYEEDHICPLELGGNPRDPSNLRPQKWTGPWNAHVKDKLENRLHKLVCAGTIDLETAQREISTDWIASYKARMQ